MTLHLPQYPDRPPLSDDPEWYRTSVFYEVLVRGFSDLNGDGSGELRGIIDQLDYLEWLGVDCLWLLPFFQSPLRDGGYDISDFFTRASRVRHGGRRRRAHRRVPRTRHPRHRRHGDEPHLGRSTRGSRSRRQSRTNPKADWYVWGDDDQRWTDARVIFVDTEPSNWTWDPSREQYYWHRFFHHQPDLNYDNPEVAEAMLDVVRFWLDLGLDGFRLDAVPYLFERDGTNGENLPETHRFLKRVAPGGRRRVTRTACCWPRPTSGPPTSSTTSAQGDECHMCFHFPLMPRMFMAIRREQRFPITEMLAQTPDDPRRVPVGHVPAQPRRADARDGDRRRARLHVRRVRQATRA